ALEQEQAWTGEKPAHRVVHPGKWIRESGGGARHDFAPERPARGRAATHVATSDYHLADIFPERPNEIGNAARRMTEIGVHHDEQISRRRARPGHDCAG